MRPRCWCRYWWSQPILCGARFYHKVVMKFWCIFVSIAICCLGKFRVRTGIWPNITKSQRDNLEIVLILMLLLVWLRSWQRNSCLSERTWGCAGVVLRRWENENDRIDLCNVTTTVTRSQTPAPPPSLPSGGGFTTFTWLIQTQPQLAEASFEQVQEIS